MTLKDAREKAAIPEKFLKAFIVFMKLWTTTYASVDGWGISKAMAKKMGFYDASWIANSYMPKLLKFNMVKKIGHGKYAPTEYGKDLWKRFNK